jgi:hypothetical protein
VPSLKGSISQRKHFKKLKYTPCLLFRQEVCKNGDVVYVLARFWLQNPSPAQRYAASKYKDETKILVLVLLRHRPGSTGCCLTLPQPKFAFPARFIHGLLASTRFCCP